jgi:uncharacterized protein (TIGR00156 family)
MPFRVPLATLSIALLAATAHAQPAPGYSGPSADARAAAPAGNTAAPGGVPLMSVQQLLDSGRDDQHARLQGRIVSHERGDNYTFADDSGRIRVEIDDDRFPVGQSIGADQRVELLGEFEKGLLRHEFDVDRLTVLP